MYDFVNHHPLAIALSLYALFVMTLIIIDIIRKPNADSEITDILETTSPEDMAREIVRLRHDCGEFYQVIGYLADKANVFEDERVVKALNNAYAASQGDTKPHHELLPFIVG